MFDLMKNLASNYVRKPEKKRALTLTYNYIHKKEGQRAVNLIRSYTQLYATIRIRNERKKLQIFSCNRHITLHSYV